MFIATRLVFSASIQDRTIETTVLISETSPLTKTISVATPPMPAFNAKSAVIKDLTRALATLIAERETLKGELMQIREKVNATTKAPSAVKQAAMMFGKLGKMLTFTFAIGTIGNIASNVAKSGLFVFG